MKIASLFSRIAQLNLFGRRAIAKTPTSQSGADTYHVTPEPLLKRKVSKDAISAPLGFANKRQGKILERLVGPGKAPKNYDTPWAFKLQGGKYVPVPTNELTITFND